MAIFSIQKNNKTPKLVAKKRVVQNNKVDRMKALSPEKTVRVDLVKHAGVRFSPEYFSYMNNDGVETKFSGIIINDVDGSYIGKQVINHKVEVEYHPKVESVKYSPEYFTYINADGKEKKFIGQPEFDLEKNAYVGTVFETVLHDKVIEIFEEK